MVHRLFLIFPSSSPPASIMALTITTGLTGIFSCEVPGGGSFHSGNLITSFWYGGLFGYGLRGEEGGNLKIKKKILLQSVGNTDILTIVPTSFNLESLYNSKLQVMNSYLNHYIRLIVPNNVWFFKSIHLATADEPLAGHAHPTPFPRLLGQVGSSSSPQGGRGGGGMILQAACKIDNLKHTVCTAAEFVVGEWRAVITMTPGAVWLTGSWWSGRVSGLSLWGGRAELRTLVHQRPPGPT